MSRDGRCLPPGQALNRQILARFNEADYIAIRAKQEASGLNMTDWLRKVILAAVQSDTPKR